MNPTGSDLQVNIPLMLVQNAFLADQSEFIASQVFPIIPVQRRSGNYWTFNKDSWLRAEAQERAPSTPSVGSGFTVSQGALYYARRYAIHKDVDYETRAENEANGFFDIDAVSTRWVTRQLLLKRELLWANTYFRTGVWTTDMNGVSAAPGAGQFLRWDNANSTPIDDVTGKALDVYELTGFKPNTLVLTPRGRRALRRNPQILDAAKSIANYTGEPMVTDALLAEVLEVERILVASALVNNAPEGSAAQIAPLFGKNALLVYASQDPNLEMPSGGYTFTWNGYLQDGGFEGNRVTTFFMEEIRSDRIEGEMAFDMRIVAPDTGVFFSSIIA